MDVLGRYRNLIVLVGVLFAQVLGLAVQVKRTSDSEPTRLIRIWAVGAVTPLERVLVWVQTSTGNVWHNYFYLRGVLCQGLRGARSPGPVQLSIFAPKLRHGIAIIDPVAKRSSIPSPTFRSRNLRADFSLASACVL